MDLNSKKEIAAETMDRMKKELGFLKKVKRKDIAEKLRHAISFGDLKENAAYHEAKEEQAFLEGKIKELSNTIKNSIIASGGSDNANIVSIGSRITAKLKSQEEKYLIVNSVEADPLNGKISVDSPIGKVILGKSEGDRCQVKMPSGEDAEIEITKIERK